MVMEGEAVAPPPMLSFVLTSSRSNDAEMAAAVLTSAFPLVGVAP